MVKSKRENIGKLVVRCFKGSLEGRMKSYIDGRLEEILSRRVWIVWGIPAGLGGGSQ